MPSPGCREVSAFLNPQKGRGWPEEWFPRRGGFAFPGGWSQASGPAMISFTESVTVAASSGLIWTRLMDFGSWWPVAHPDHLRVELHSGGKSVVEGTQIDFEERLAGMRSVATGQIVSLHPGVEATWEGRAVYRHLGLRIPLQTGVKWRLAAMGSDMTILSASMWSGFSGNAIGHLLEWYARQHLKMVERSRAHMRRELDSLKDGLEAGERVATRGDRDDGLMAASA